MSKYYYVGEDGALRELQGSIGVVHRSSEQNQGEINSVNESARSQTTSVTPILPRILPFTSIAESTTKTSRLTKQNTKGRTTLSTQNQPRVAAIDNPQEPVVNLTKKQLKNPRVHDIYDDPDLIYCIETRLLEEVFRRPPLFDSTLSYKDRSEDVKIRLFQEISKILCNDMDENITWQVVANTWKHHRTLYTRYVNAKKSISAGSTTVRVPLTPEYFNILKQYDEIIEKRSQISSLSNEPLDKFPPEKRTTKVESVNKYLKTANRFLENIEKVPTSSTTQSVRASSESDTNYVFLCSLLPDINKLKPKDERNFKKKLMESLYSYLDKYDDENEAVQNQRNPVKETGGNPYDTYFGVCESDDEN